MNTAFKQRRARIGALTFTLAALFGFAVIRLVVLVALLRSAAELARAAGAYGRERARARCAGRSSIATASRWRCRPRRARSTRGRRKCSSRARRPSAAKLAAILMMVPISLEQKLEQGSAVRVARAPDVTGQGAGGGSARHRRHRHDQRVQKVLSGEQPGRVGGGVGGDGRPGALRIGVAATTRLRAARRSS